MKPLVLEPATIARVHEPGLRILLARTGIEKALGASFASGPAASAELQRRGLMDADQEACFLLRNAIAHGLGGRQAPRPDELAQSDAWHQATYRALLADRPSWLKTTELESSALPAPGVWAFTAALRDLSEARQRARRLPPRKLLQLRGLHERRAFLLESLVRFRAMIAPEVREHADAPLHVLPAGCLPAQAVQTIADDRLQLVAACLLFEHVLREVHPLWFQGRQDFGEVVDQHHGELPEGALLMAGLKLRNALLHPFTAMPDFEEDTGWRAGQLMIRVARDLAFRHGGGLARAVAVQLVSPAWLGLAPEEARRLLLAQLTQFRNLATAPRSGLPRGPLTRLLDWCLGESRIFALVQAEILPELDQLLGDDQALDALAGVPTG